MPGAATRIRPRHAWLVIGGALVAGGVAIGVTLNQEQAGVPVVTPPIPSASAAPSSSGASAPEARRGDPTYSNIHQYDYVGPMACRGCHAQIYALWQSHPHARMNANANAGTVVGAFDGRTLEYGGASVRFDKVDGDYVMDIRRGEEPVRRFRITRTIGSRFIQMYAGVQLAGPEPDEAGDYRREGKLPFAYWIDRDEWFPQTYDEVPPAGELDDEGKLTAHYDYTTALGQGEWKRSCALCHNTYPYADRFGSLGQGKLLGFPPGDVSLTNKRGQPRDERGAAVLEPWQLVSLGISCESCHFGAREHALKGAKISFVPRADSLVMAKATPEMIAGARQDHYVINSICGQCHTAQAQGVTYPDGGSSWNSAEAKDIHASACSSAIKCTDCHDPHRAGPRPSGGPDSAEQLQACGRCHEAFASPTAATSHSAHDDTVTCMDCHMPRIVHGLDGMIRSHRISSPTDPKMIAGAWPNACNLCHLDRSMTWTLSALAERWNVEVALDESNTAATTEPMGRRWLTHPEPVVRQVAVDAYSRHPPDDHALELILPSLLDESPPNRMFGRLAIERLVGRRLSEDEYRPWATPEERKRSVDALGQKLEPAQSK
jgi:Cytochrome c552